MNIPDPGTSFPNTPPAGQYIMASTTNQNIAPSGVLCQPNDTHYGNQYAHGYTAPYVTQTTGQQPQPQNHGSVNMTQHPGMTTNFGCVANPINYVSSNLSQQQEPLQTSMMRPATPPSYKEYQAQVQAQTHAQPQMPNQNPSLTSLLQSLDNRLGKIEGQMNFQIQQMSHQNNRIQNIERHVEQITVLKQSVTQIETKMCYVDNDLTQIKSRQSEYEQSINTYSNMCDDILKAQVSTNERISQLTNTMNNLLTPEIETMKKDHYELKEDFLDTKTRQMWENLIFTGIDEVSLNRGEFENCEATLRNHMAEKWEYSKTLSLIEYIDLVDIEGTHIPAQ